MSHRTSIRRTAAIVGTSGIIALSMAAPASARQDPGTGNQQEWSCRSLCYEGGTPGSNVTSSLTADDGTIEVVQLGAGVLAGVALAGAGLAVATRRRHAHAHAAHPA